MRGLIESVIARLAAHDVAGYWLEVPDKPTWPYVVLWSTAGRLPAMEPGHGGQEESSRKF